MIEAVAFCPQAPALVPAVGRGLDAELGQARAASRRAIRATARGDRRLVVIGSGEQTRRYLPTAHGTFAGFGVPLTVGLGSDEPGPVELPPALTVAAWLLGDALGPGCGASGWTAGADPLRLGVDPDVATALLVVGDGSACRTEKAPGYFDPRAERRDRAIADALRAGEADALHADSGLDDELLVAGSRAWAAAAELLGGRRYDADLLYEGAPFGVGYFVATWTARAA